MVAQHTNCKIGCYSDMASRWPCVKKFDSLNCISAEVCWGIWNMRNDMIFRDISWQDIKQVLRKIWRNVTAWIPMLKNGVDQDVAKWCSFLEAALKTPLAIVHQ